MVKNYKTLGIIGAGAWGSALAVSLSKNFTNTIIYANSKQIVDNINLYKTNDNRLPKDVYFSNSVLATNNIYQAIECDVVLLAVPTQYIASVFNNIIFPTNNIMLITSKGIDIKSHNLISQVVLHNAKINLEQIGVLSGPTFANLIASNKPSTFVVAMATLELAKSVASILSNNTLRLYYSTDINGIQVLGAVKNIIAIASGIIDGANLGHNALAGLVTRSLKEISLLVKHYNGNIDSVFGLAGIGDLLLTTTSNESRNFSLGQLIGKHGKFCLSMLDQLKGVPEGYYTVKALKEIISSYNLEMPICNAVYNVCYNNLTLHNLITSLMNRNITQDANF